MHAHDRDSQGNLRADDGFAAVIKHEAADPDAPGNQDQTAVSLRSCARVGDDDSPYCASETKSG